MRLDEDDNLNDDDDVDGPRIDGEVLMSANRRKPFCYAVLHTLTRALSRERLPTQYCVPGKAPKGGLAVIPK